MRTVLILLKLLIARVMLILLTERVVLTRLTVVARMRGGGARRPDTTKDTTRDTTRDTTNDTTNGTTNGITERNYQGHLSVAIMANL